MKGHSDVCPLCEEGVLVETQEDGLLFSVCTACQAEIANAEQMKKNKEAFAEHLRGCEGD